jgi:hypothetical protein
MVKLTMWVFFMLIAFGIMLATYGGVNLYFRTDRLDLAEAQRVELVNCELKVRDLRLINSLIPILEQILTECQLDELGILSERIRQKRDKNYEAIEQPMLNEKELKKLKDNT